MIIIRLRLLPRIIPICNAIIFILGIGSISNVLAAPEEIEIYLDDFAEVGKTGLDLHTNYVASGQPKTNHQFRLTPELSYGVNTHWEVAGYWLTVTDPDGLPRTDGVKARARWRPALPSADTTFCWALNFEIGELSKEYYADETSAEIKLITVLKNEKWKLGINFNIDGAIKSYPVQAASSEIDTKVAYKIREGLQVGIESYAYLGAIRVSSNQPQSLNQPQNSTTNYLVSDFNLGDWDFNAGLGFVSGTSSDSRVIKVIIGVPL